KALREILHPRAFRPPTQAVPQRHHGRQRHDDRRHAEVRDQASVQRAERRADQARRDRGNTHRSRRLCGDPCHDAADREDGSDRDVDVAGQDHERRTDRDDEHRHVAEEEFAEVLARVVARRSRRQHEAEGGDNGYQTYFATMTHEVNFGSALSRSTDPGSRKRQCPSAAAMMFAAVAASRSIVATIVPACMTAMRSLMPRISGSSYEIMMIAMPRSARSCINLWISALDPTSTPWVGSSRMSTDGPVASQR